MWIELLTYPDACSQRLHHPTQHTTMSPLHKTAASRLFAAAYRPSFSRQIPRVARFESTAAKSGPSLEANQTQSRDEPPSPVHLTKGEVGSKAPASETTPRHAPDYGAAVDYRTS